MGTIELPTRGFSVLPVVFSVPEHRPTSDIRRYYISTSAAALGGRERARGSRSASRPLVCDAPLDSP
jgi:hypothetical protein